MRLYSDSEVEVLIDELSQAAIEAIEKAAGEAARETVLSLLEQQAKLLYETQRLKEEAERMRKGNFRNLLLTGIAGFAVGLIAGLIINR